MTEIIVRNVDIIAAEICSIKDQTRKIVLGNSIEIGKRLVEAKDIVPHGEWGRWLQESVDYSQSTANNLMRIFEEYGANQMTLFGADAKSQALGNLSYTQAVALLSVPAEEREAFLEGNDLESMSTRELQAAIKDKQELERKLKETEEAAEKDRLHQQQTNEELTRVHNERMAKLNEDLAKAQAAGDNMTAKKLKADLDKFKKDHAAAAKRVKELEEELEKKPVDEQKTEIPEATLLELETLRQRELELTNQTKQLQEESAKKIADMESLIEKNNNTAAIKVKVVFDTLVGNFKELLEAIGEVKNEEEKQKFQGAIAKLCDKMKGAV